MNNKRVIVIGAGASGYFSAIRIKELNPEIEVVLLEKTGKTLAKLRISGGGRCNVTHDCRSNALLLTQYPRGRSFLKKVFKRFSVSHTIDWFLANGVALKTEVDGRMFPITNSSETVAEALEFRARKLGVDLRLLSSVVTIIPLSKDGFYAWQVNCNSGTNEMANAVVLAIGGFPKEAQYNMIKQLNINIIKPVPSLFTFNISDAYLHEMHGLSVMDARIKLQGFDETYNGPLLITYWGISGPAVLKTSAWGARWMNEKNYETTVYVSWLNKTEDEMRLFLQNAIIQNTKKMLENLYLEGIPRRLWEFVILRAGVLGSKISCELSKYEFNKIIENLLRMPFEIDGKTSFKEEFVTAGGIDLAEINPETMEMRKHPGLYATGEILDIDGVTGGYNFQAAWSTAAIVSESIAKIKDKASSIP